MFVITPYAEQMFSLRYTKRCFILVELNQKNSLREDTLFDHSENVRNKQINNIYFYQVSDYESLECVEFLKKGSIGITVLGGTFIKDS